MSSNFFIRARTDRFASEKGYLTRRKHCRPHADDPPRQICQEDAICHRHYLSGRAGTSRRALENNEGRKRIRETKRERERERERGGEMPRRCPRSRGAQNGGERNGAKRKPWKGIIALRALVSPASRNRDRFPSGSRLLARQFSLARFSLPRRTVAKRTIQLNGRRVYLHLSLFSRLSPLARISALAARKRARLSPRSPRVSLTSPYIFKR